MPYRPDIDGLRAFAIAVVVLFHAGFDAVPGGFVGVDIFFVISGFLITGLIIERLRQGEFSFWEFYARRIRRIFPALFTLLPVVLLAGYFMLTPAEYQTLGASAAYSSAFLANVYFWLHTGYFDQGAETMPLLHLWSIGVEEQFYLIWPLSLVVVWRYVRLGQSATLAALTGVTLLLALLCVVWTGYDAKSAFYLPFTRLWEFTLGALLLALPAIRQPRVADGLSLLGLAAMGYAALAFNADLNYPGYYALLPCAGAAAVIASGERSIVGRLLSLGPNVLLGKISYSLYLWHWPLIVFYGYYFGLPPLTTTARVSLILAATAIALMSWRFIELPVRRRRGLPVRHVVYGTAGGVLVGCLALIVVSTAGFAGRIPEALRPLSSHEKMTATKCSERVAIPGLGKKGRRACVFGAPWSGNDRWAVLWGDSHAAHLAPLLDLPAKKQGISIIRWKGCAPFIDDRTLGRREHMSGGEYSTTCGKTRKVLLDFIRVNPNVKLVIIANAWPSYASRVYVADTPHEHLDDARALGLMEKGLAATLAEITSQNRSVLLVGDIPKPPFAVPDCLMQKALKLWRQPCSYDTHFLNRNSVFAFHRPTESILARLTSARHRIYYLDLMTSICGPEGCPLRVNNEVIYADDNHLRRDLSLDTRRKLVTLFHLGDALRSAIHEPPGSERAEAR